MALSKVTFNKGQGGLGRPAAGEDYISGLVIYDDDLPSGFSSSAREVEIFSLEEAENLGILNDYSDATAASGGGFTVTATGADGNTIAVNVVLPQGTVTLGTYTKVSADTTAALVAAGIRTAINNGTSEHGFVAGGAAAVISLTAPLKYGVYLNTFGVSTTIVGTITVGTPTTFSAGVASKLAQYHYQISEYFRINPTGDLFVGFYDSPVSYNFSEVETLQIFAQGKIRQCGILTDRATVYAATMCDSLQAVYDTLYTGEMPCEMYLGAEFDTATVASIADLSTKTDEDVCVITACDDSSNGQGKFLRLTGDVTIPALGAFLGAVSRAKVSDNVAWVGQFDMSNGTELETVGFLKGIAYNTVSTSAMTNLENKRYIFLRKFVGRSGSFWNDDVTAVSSTSDYSNTRLNRTIDKAIRLVRTAMQPRLNQPIIVNSDGTLSGDVIDDFKTTALTPLDQMVSDEEISDRQVLINPNQNILATSELIMTIKIIPLGSAKFITINIGFATSL